MANFNFNKVMLGGRLTAKPEMRQTLGGIPVCSFTMAVNRRARSGEQAVADFFNVTAWRGAAELVCKYFDKGSAIFVVGTVQNRTWTDQSGVKRYATDVVADEISFVDGKSEGAAAPSGEVEPVNSSDDDVPF
jgi:single-strand DNA-binding protein